MNEIIVLLIKWFHHYDFDDIHNALYVSLLMRYQSASPITIPVLGEKRVVPLGMHVMRAGTAPWKIGIRWRFAGRAVPSSRSELQLISADPSSRMNKSRKAGMQDK